MRDRAVKCLQKAIEVGKMQHSDLHEDIRNSNAPWLLASKTILPPLGVITVRSVRIWWPCMVRPSVRHTTSTGHC